MRSTIIEDITTRKFLLIQGGVLSTADTPDALDYDLCDASKTWEVFLGHVNEFGDREISGCVARVHPCLDCRTWRISSDQDGYARLVGAIGSPDYIIAQRLMTLYWSDRFYDVACMPMAVEVMPG